MLKALCGFNDGPNLSGADALLSFGPTLLVKIGFDPSYGAATPQTVPDLPETQHHALIDTGATECCIDSALAMALNLPVIDQRTYSGIGGHTTVNMHLAQIHAPTLRFTMFGAFAGVNLAAGGQQHRALIGRTFLRRFRFLYEGPTGNVWLEGPLA